MPTLTYREAARRVRRSVITIKRWRRRGHLHMTWETRDGQRVRVVDEEALLKCFRDRLKNDPVHQKRLARAKRNARDTPNEKAS